MANDPFEGIPNADDMQYALPIETVHTGLSTHDGYAEHSHEVRSDHRGVAREDFARVGGIPSAAALAQAFADSDVLDDVDVSTVRPVAGRASDARFFCDDGTWEYEVTVRKVRQS